MGLFANTEADFLKARVHDPSNQDWRPRKETMKRAWTDEELTADWLLSPGEMEIVR
jgi:hypothetical protein